MLWVKLSHTQSHPINTLLFGTWNQRKCFDWSLTSNINFARSQNRLQIVSLFLLQFVGLCLYTQICTTICMTFFFSIMVMNHILKVLEQLSSPFCSQNPHFNTYTRPLNLCMSDRCNRLFTTGCLCMLTCWFWRLDWLVHGCIPHGQEGV